MSAATATSLPSGPALIPPHGKGGHQGGVGGWIVSPAFDLVFLANLGWLLALVPGYVSAEGTPHVEFWQLYFLTLPHRWITLFLVALDPDRRDGRHTLFFSLALLALVLVGSVRLTRGEFQCILFVDYVWNAWHFASQHFGVLRMYSRKAGGRWEWLERHGLRWFIFYVIVRTAGWSTGWLEASPSSLSLLNALDLLVLAVPITLLVLELRDYDGGRLGKLIYLASVSGVYTALLLALSERHKVMVLALTTATGAFHAVEYLAIVTHYAWRRQHHGSAGLFRNMVGRWALVLVAYVLVLGLAAVMLEGPLADWWLGLNLWASLLHYTYDGLIWRLRKPETARALGVEARPAHSQHSLPVTVA